MAVGSSSSSPLLSLLSLLSSPPRTAIRGLHSSPLPSPKPLTKRRNHLRTKLPKTLETPPPNPPPRQTHQLGEPREAPAIAHLPALEAEVEALGYAAEAFPPAPAHPWLPGPVLDLGLRFALLLVVQTLAAVWFLGGGGGGRGGGDGSLERRRREGLEQGRVEGSVAGVIGEGSEFETRLQLIRAMVKEVREKERRDLAAGKDGISDGIGRGIARSRKSSSTNSMSLDGSSDTGESNERRKLESPSSDAKSRIVSNGFGGSEANDDDDDDDDDDANGGYQQIGYHSPVEEPSQLRKTDEVRTPNSSTPRNLYNLENLTASSSRHDNSIEEKELMLNDRNTQSPIKAAKVNRKNGDIDAEKKSWWLKLPYVLGIFLRRGVERSGPRGLYSLNMDSSPEDEDSPSYTIAFQDHGDATNFCYLLESFFEGLGDVSADVVPLTIQELSEAVESNELKLLVVRKGQLRLYAGQPLAEVETALRSLIG